MFKIIEGDLFDTDAKYLCHQCNCVTTRSAHLAYEVFKRYSYADVYSPRAARNGDRLHAEGLLKHPDDIKINSYADKPGDILVRGNGEDQRYVIAMLGQYFPGKVRFSDSKLDGFKARQRYFHQALWKIAQMDSIDSVAFPFGIACGAAGGDWNIYLKMIESFSNYLPNVDVLVYHKK